MMDWLMVVPTVGPQWVIDGFLERVESDLLGHFLFVDSTRDGAVLAKNDRHRLRAYGAFEPAVLHHPENLGWAKSMNLGLRLGHDVTKVYRCCALAYNDAGLIGSIGDRRFRELWMDPARADSMAAFDARDCERCPYRVQGGLLEYTLSPRGATSCRLRLSSSRSSSRPATDCW